MAGDIIPNAFTNVTQQRTKHKYNITPLIRKNWDGQPFRYAENQDNLIFFFNMLQWQFEVRLLLFTACRLRLKCDGTRAETRFRLPEKRTSPLTLR